MSCHVFVCAWHANAKAVAVACGSQPHAHIFAGAAALAAGSCGSRVLLVLAALGLTTRGPPNRNRSPAQTNPEFSDVMAANRKKKRKEKPVQIQPWLLRTYLAAKSSTRPPATGTSSRVLGPPPDPGSCTMSWIQDDDQTAVGSWLLAVEGG
jgi:hypothetical protein